MRKSAEDGGTGVAGPFLDLFRVFFDTYLVESGDRELSLVLPPFFAFRALVIAHPRWYPTLSDAARRALLAFAEAMAEASAFDPNRVSALLGGAR